MLRNCVLNGHEYLPSNQCPPARQGRRFQGGPSGSENDQRRTRSNRDRDLRGECCRGLPSAIHDFPPEANGGPAHAGCAATISRPRQCKRMVDQLTQGAPPQSVGHASASEWWTSSCRVPRHSQSATPVQANGGPAHAGCPATVSRPRQCKRMVDQLMQGAPPQSVGHASASEWWTSSCRVPRHSQSATPVI